jgi:uncharacterized repeat protein (TIGR01451 family)
MKSFFLQLFLALGMTSATLFAHQGPYKLAYNVGNQTYTVYGKVSAAYNPPMSRFANVYGGDTYNANYGGNAVCTMLVPPTVSVGFSNPMTVGQQGTMTLTLTNSTGNPAQTGIGYTYTLPPGLSFPAGATVTNSCGGTGTLSGDVITFANGTMASGMATCTLTAPVLAAAQGTINPTTGRFSNPTNVTMGLNNGVGANPVNIVVNPAACNANAGILSY